MRRSRKISIDLPMQQLLQVKRAVDAGEFASSAAVIREALRAWLHRRTLHAGQHGVTRLKRGIEARRDLHQHAEPFERVELLFDAGDAKA